MHVYSTQLISTSLNPKHMHLNGIGRAYKFMKNHKKLIEVKAAMNETFCNKKQNQRTGLKGAQAESGIKCQTSDMEKRKSKANISFY